MSIKGDTPLMARSTAGKSSRRAAASPPARRVAKRPAARLAAVQARSARQDAAAPAYVPAAGVLGFVAQVRAARPLQIIQAEKSGVQARFLKDLAAGMAIPIARLYSIVGVPKATAEKKSAAGELIAGSGGQATLGLVKLIAIAQEIVENSTSPQARGFDAARWLGRWIEEPQPALGGRKPADLLDTPTGFEVVARTLGALESGAYV